MQTTTLSPKHLHISVPWGQTRITLLQKNTESSKPWVLAVHSLSGSYLEWLDPMSETHGGLITRELLDAGYTICLPELFYHGENNPDKLKLGENEIRDSYWPAFFSNSKKTIESTIEWMMQEPANTHKKMHFIGYDTGSLFALPMQKKFDCFSKIVFNSPIICRDEKQQYGPVNFLENLEETEILMCSGHSDEIVAFADQEWFFNRLHCKKKIQRIYRSGHRLSKEYAHHVAGWIMRT